MADPKDELRQAMPSVRSSNKATTDDIAAEALQVVAQLQSDFRTRDKLYEQLDRTIFLENAVRIPKAYRKTAVEVRSPHPNHIINSITAALSANAPQITFPQIGIGDSAAESKARIEKFFEASWKRQEEEAARRIFRMLIYSVVSKGEMIVKTIERSKSAWAEYGAFQKSMNKRLDEAEIYGSERDRISRGETEQYKRGAPYPIQSIDILPETFYYLKGENGFALCAEVQKVPYYSTLARYKMGLSKGGDIVPQAMGLPKGQWQAIMGNTQTLRRIELWDAEECVTILQGPADTGGKRGKSAMSSGRIVHRYRHGYGDKTLGVLRGPYFHAFGVTTNSRETHKQGLSVLYAFQHLFPLLDLLLTIQSQAAVGFGFPTYKRVTPPTLGLADAAFGLDAEEQEGGNEELEIGGILPYDIAPIDAPRTSMDIARSIADIRAMLELALPSVAQGMNVDSEASGYAINQAAHLARLAWNPIVDNVQFALGQRTAWEAELIEKRIRERVYVHGEVPMRRGGSRQMEYTPGWLFVDPDDLKGLRNFSAKLKPDTPSNFVIEIRTHQQMLQMRLETPAMAIEALGNNPVEVERGWLLHEIKNDPQIKQVLKQKLFQKLATVDQEAMAGVDKSNRPGSSPMATPNQPSTAPAGPMVPPQLAAMMGGGGGGPSPQAQAAMAAAGAGGGAMGAIRTNMPPGNIPGAPPGIRNLPGNHQPLPGEG